MANFKELMEDEVVRNHPLLDGYTKMSKVRDTILKHAQALEEEYADNPASLKDLFSSSNSEKEAGQSLRDIVYNASVELHGLLGQFNMPIFPKLSFNTTRDVHYARHNNSLVTDGKIIFNVEFIAFSGGKKTATIPVCVVNGEIVPPSVMEYDGRMFMIAQKEIDNIIGRLTSYELPELRNEFDPPMNRQEREFATQLRNSEGFQPRKNDGYLNQKKLVANIGDDTLSVVRGTPRAYDLVIADLEKAEKDGTDTFPRSWIHLLRNYILNHVSTADKDRWMIHLMNDGFCLNPYGVNRGRPRPGIMASKNAIFDKELDMEVDGEPVEMEEIVEEEAPLKEFGMYPGTKMPINECDGVKHCGPKGDMRGTVVDADVENGYLILKSKGMEYRVKLEDVEPLPSVFKKKWMN